MNAENIKTYIVKWLNYVLRSSSCTGFVVGVSGGIDSAVTSALAALTEKPLLLLNMPIEQEEEQYNLSNEHIMWLASRHDNVSSLVIDLTAPYCSMISSLVGCNISELAAANMASRLRMSALYAAANTNNFMVTGTGNKVEDYGIGFFTKYGDGGVDLSPIADLLKTEVYELAEYLGVPESIQKAAPTDGLWGDNRTDEEQIGATYEELEWALQHYDKAALIGFKLSPRQEKVLEIYKTRHLSSKHKMLLPPVCQIPKEIK